jgi:hypothetical protein
LKKALVLAIVMVLGLGTLAFAGPLSGSWDTEICFGMLQPGCEETTEDISLLFSNFESALTIDYSVCGWVFESVSVFGLCGWEEQGFTVEGTMGAFTFESDLTFLPAHAAFDRWYSAGSVSIAGVDLTGGFVLDAYGAGWAFGISGVAGACELAADVYFNSYLDPWGDLQAFGTEQTPSYCFCFENVEFSASFPFCCLETVDVSIGFSNTGFDGVTFSLAGVEVPGLAWLALDIDLTFDDGALGKYLAIEPNLSFGDVICLEFHWDIVMDSWNSGLPGYGYVIDGLRLWGIELGFDACDLGQGVAFSSFTLLDWPYHYFAPSLDGYDSNDYLLFDSLGDYLAWLICDTYWEKFSIESSSDACCGGAFGFDLNVYFGYEFSVVVEEDDYPWWLEGAEGFVLTTDYHPWLFDIARVDANFSVGLGSNFSLTGGLSMTDGTGVYSDGVVTCEGAGLSQICIGFGVTF